MRPEEKLLKSIFASVPEKHSAKWVKENPQQAAQDIDTLKLALRNIKNLLANGSSLALDEAKEWANNACKL